MVRASLITRRVAVAALIGCGISAWAPPAACLTWARFTYARGQGAESCPDETTLRAAVVARLGYDPFVLSADRTIIAIVAREHRTLRANVQIVDDTGLVKGVRRLEAALDECRELAAAMALAISIAVDPTRLQSGDGAPVVARPPAAEMPDDQLPEVRPSDSVRAAPPRAAEAREQLARPAPPRSTVVRVGADVTSGMGTAPALAFGLALSVGVWRSSGSLAVEGRYDFPASKPIAGGGEVRTSLWLGSLVGCAHLRAFFGCAIGSVGALRGEGVDLASSRSSTGLHASAGARVGAEVPIRGRWFFRPRLDVSAALARPELQVDGFTRWVEPLLSVVLGAGLGLKIP